MKKGVKPPIILPYSKSLNLQKLQNSIVQKESYIHLKGLYGSAKSFVIEKLFKDYKNDQFLNLKSTIIKNYSQINKDNKKRKTRKNGIHNSFSVYNSRFYKT